MPTLQSTLEWLENRVLPPTCLLCGGAAERSRLDLCTGCRTDLPVNRPACRRCAEPLGGANAQWSPWCGGCLARQPPWDAAFSAYRYEFPVDYLVTGLKFRRQLAAGRVLGICMALELAGYLDNRELPRPQTLIPVPLHPWREWRRGFNQARELSRPVARMLNLNLNAGIVRRTAATREQSGLNAAERRKNLRGAFRVWPNHGFTHVAIVDDVITTGCTAAELARGLRASGVEVVEIWSCARAARSSGAS